MEDNFEIIERGLLSDVNAESDFIIIDTQGPVVEKNIPRDMPGSIPREMSKPARKVSAKVLNYLGTVKETTSFKTRNHKVWLLQSLLNQLGYQLNPDGFFGQLTTQQVKKFQADKGLKVDGIVGRTTWGELIYYGKIRVSNSTIQQEDYEEAAKTLGVEVAVVKAIKDVEAGGSGYVFSNHPTILFESHVFWKNLEKRGIKPSKYKDPEILNKTWNEGKTQYVGGVGEYARLQKARLINVDAANAAASWGLFQIMGSNHKACGYDSLDEFVKHMCMSESEQLRLFVNFIKYYGMQSNLKGDKKNWEAFAKAYNGPGYASNKYHIKLMQAYNKYK